MSPRKKFGFALLMVSILLLAACTPKEDAEPTPDTNMVYTQAAQTVAAQLAAQTTVEPTLDPNLIRTEAAQTVEAELAKKATATQPAPLATVAPLNTVGPLPVLASPTAGIPLTSTGNSAEWIGAWPEDGSNITVGIDVDALITMKNTGTKTWTKEYKYRFYSGIGQFHKISSYPMPKEVLPGEEVTLTVDIKSNLPNGNYYEYWVLTDNFGANFGQFDMSFTVGGAAAPTSVNVVYSDPDFCCKQRRPEEAYLLTRCTDWAKNEKGIDENVYGVVGWDPEDIKQACK